MRFAEFFERPADMHRERNYERFGYLDEEDEE